MMDAQPLKIGLHKHKVVRLYANDLLTTLYSLMSLATLALPSLIELVESRLADLFFRRPKPYQSDF